MNKSVALAEAHMTVFRLRLLWGFFFHGLLTSGLKGKKRSNLSWHDVDVGQLSKFAANTDIKNLVDVSSFPSMYKNDAKTSRIKVRFSCVGDVIWSQTLCSSGATVLTSHIYKERKWHKPSLGKFIFLMLHLCFGPSDDIGEGSITCTKGWSRRLGFLFGKLSCHPAAGSWLVQRAVQLVALMTDSSLSGASMSWARATSSCHWVVTVYSIHSSRYTTQKSESPHVMRLLQCNADAANCRERTRQSNPLKS